MAALEKFQSFLRDLFQLDLADLDFGIYRLLHIKHKEIENFIGEQLPRRVTEAFARMAGDEAGTLQNEIDDLAAKIIEDVADDALLETGEINPEYQKAKTKSVKRLLDQYSEMREKLKSIQASESEQNDIFNHLYTFFSRYYDNGDFIPRRRYGARETYAVPYNGEETVFHWANRDQHYVKTGERFQDYAFTVEIAEATYHIRFCLTDASLPPGNTKGDVRYFFPLPEQLTWEHGDKTAVLPFHYRPSTEADLTAYDNLKNSRLQEAILTAAIPEILNHIDNASLRAGLSAPSDPDTPDSISILEKRLRHFCKKNTSDYFIHKDLAGFLNMEMEFYLKDQVVHLADLEADIQPRLRILRVIRTLAGEIITFLAQIEDVQKRLFEKRKLVLRADYIIPIKEIPSSFWPEICSNADQTAQWQSLFGIDSAQFRVEANEAATIQFLETHPTLTIDTACFNSDFIHRLLATFTDLDESIDGLFIHSENYQGLRFIERRNAGKIKCISIDPPYNTGSDEFLYKDGYQSSSWAAMLLDRLKLSHELLSQDGLFFLQIGDDEEAMSRFVLDQVFPERKNTVVVRRGVKNVQAQFTNIDRLTGGHDIIHVYARTPGLRLPHLRKSHEEEKPGKWDTFWRGTDRPTMRYELHGKNPPTGQWRWEKSRSMKSVANYEDFLINQSARKSLDEWYVENLQAGVELDFVRLNEEDVVQYYVPPQGYRLLSDNWLDLSAFGNFTEFVTEKNLDLLSRIISWNTNTEDTVLDFFAGSGTTAHAVINLNREDGCKRKFILVEMADYFDTVLLPRIRKVMYTPEWKDGQPKRLPTAEEADRTPRIIKVLRLESYEDALHNLITDDTRNREAPRADAIRNMVGGDPYRLSYLVRLPLDASASLLNLEALNHPFDYRIEVLTGNGPKSQTVNLVETFNYLYGLHVQRLETWVNPVDSRHYRAVLAKDKKRQKVLVLWRDMDGYDPVIERRFLEAKLRELAVSFDECLINSNTATPGFRSLDGIFKQLVMEGER